MKQDLKAKRFILQLSWDFCHLKNAELEKQFQKIQKECVKLRVDVVWDDSSLYAVFTVTHDHLQSSGCCVQSSRMRSTSS